MSDNEGRDLFIGHLRSWLVSGLTNAPLTDLYNTTDGLQSGNFEARPVVGGHLGQSIHRFVNSSLTLLFLYPFAIFI